MSGSRRIADAYTPDWLEDITSATDILRIGFALYDTENYEEALKIFAKLEQIAADSGGKGVLVMALIWQGHMLDLLGRRDQALARYQRVVDMNSNDGARHDQYGLAYRYSAYAAERLRTPFQRIRNKEP